MLNVHSDIRGVSVAGVEGEPVNLTEPVAEAIAAAFSGWLVEKKKADASGHLRVSIGHDSRISAQVLQVSCLNIIVFAIFTITHTHTYIYRIDYLC